MSEAPIHAARIWWDGEQRLWTRQWLDRKGNEVGETGYSAHKSPLMGEIYAHEERHGPLTRYIGTRKGPAPEPGD